MSTDTTSVNASDSDDSLSSLTESINIDEIKENENLLPTEKETSMGWSKVENLAQMHTDELGLMRRFVLHPEFRVEGVHRNDGYVTSVRGKIPIDCITISRKPRQSGSRADVVTSSVLSEGQ